MTILRLAIALGLLGLAACASDACTDGNSATQNVANKFASCANDDPGFFGGYSPCFDVNACEQNLKACSAADKKVLEAVVTCQNDYSNTNDCSEAGLQAYNDCASNASNSPDGGSNLSPACAAGFAQNQGTCDAG